MEKEITRTTVRSIRKLDYKPEYVYNLEIEDNHNYFINNILVHNCPNVIVDESAEIPDDIFGNIFRMLADDPDNFLCELGNPWFLNHFYRSWKDDNYYKIKINWQQAVAEGRVPLDFIEEARKQPHFDVLWEGNFPEEGVISKDGWLPLFSKTMIDVALRDQDEIITAGPKMMGVDISYSGGDQNVWCIRDSQSIRCISRDNNKNPLELVGKTILLAKKYGVDIENIYLDSTAGGNIVLDEFRNLGYDVNGISFGESAFDKEKYQDRKTEGYYMMYEFLSHGGKLVQDDIVGDEWKQLSNIKIKAKNGGVCYIISKTELRKLGVSSPDVADAAMLTCIGGLDIIPARKQQERVSDRREKRTRFR